MGPSSGGIYVDRPWKEAKAYDPPAIAVENALTVAFATEE
jgi:hypothetical protein